MDLDTHQLPDGTQISLRGPVDEEADFVPVLTQINRGGRFVLDLAGVSHINSSGVREWIRFVRGIRGGGPVELTNCPPQFIDQVNMLNNFLGSTTVQSLVVPFVCIGCGETLEQTARSDTLVSRDPEPPRCERCGATMELDAIADVYFAFLREPRHP